MSREQKDKRMADSFPGEARFRMGKLTLCVYAISQTSLYADVEVEGEPDTVYSIRLDADEDTVTVYDPDADEGETVWEPSMTSDRPERHSMRGVCPKCHAEQKEGEQIHADGSCYPACLPDLNVYRGQKWAKR